MTTLLRCLTFYLLMNTTVVFAESSVFPVRDWESQDALDRSFSNQLHPNIFVQKDRDTYEFQYNQFLNNMTLNGLKTRLQARLVPESFTIIVVQETGVRVDRCENIIYVGYESSDELTSFLANRFPLQQSDRGRSLRQQITAINNASRDKLQLLQKKLGVQITYDLNNGMCLGPNYFNRTKLLLGLINIEREINRRHRQGQVVPTEFALVDGFWSLPAIIDLKLAYQKYIQKTNAPHYLRYDDMLSDEDNLELTRILDADDDTIEKSPAHKLVSSDPQLTQHHRF